MNKYMSNNDYESISIYYSRCLDCLRHLEDVCCNEFDNPDVLVLDSLNRLIDSVERELSEINNLIVRDIDDIEEFIDYEI